ncbi:MULTISPECIES: hypothetical protein [unclassified Streptomyces]|uniref:hypothetical protein n=1 Tax=unclassified Streptomyces TaxID=2593676 RepID=UPI002DDB1900|nr:hypothetical protein [Streptomyces sp. NBC_01750]WSA99107.1 hypothetical protein OIE54_07455 [Streptomyces sp. NBC_01794]WSD36328.1 hypothetical protein OG966_33120 [Streptomyces sp. NBC_01750]
MLTRAEDAASDATVGLGQRILQLVWRRGDKAGRDELERVVGEAADEQDDAYTTAVLSRLLKGALEDDPELREELAGVLPAPAADTVDITASVSDRSPVSTSVPRSLVTATPCPGREH